MIEAMMYVHSSGQALGRFLQFSANFTDKELMLTFKIFQFSAKPAVS